MAALLAATTSAAVGFFFTISEYENAVPPPPQAPEDDDTFELLPDDAKLLGAELLDGAKLLLFPLVPMIDVPMLNPPFEVTIPAPEDLMAPNGGIKVTTMMSNAI